MLSRFHLIPERHGQTVTDRQTDGQNCYINIARYKHKNGSKSRFVIFPGSVENKLGDARNETNSSSQYRPTSEIFLTKNF